MELDLVRKELNNYDDTIKILVALRMSLIPIVADIKIKNNLPLFQAKREAEIYNKIEKFALENGVNKELVKDIYKLIISDAMRIEETISKNEEESIINNNKEELNNDIIKENFQRLDSILSKEIPGIIANILKEKENLNLTEIATLYYNQKIKE